MKAPLFVSLVLLAGIAALGWHDHQRLAAVRSDHAKLVADAAKLGISIDPDHPDERARVTKISRRESADDDANQVAADLIAFMREAKSMSGGSPDAASLQRLTELMSRLLALDADQMKLFLDAVRSLGDLTEEERRGLVSTSIMMLASDHPQAALTLLSESTDLVKDPAMGKILVNMAVTKWAKDDPLGAVRWVRKNNNELPDLVTVDAKKQLLAGAATQDPKLAFQLIDELGLTMNSEAVVRISRAAGTPEERTATLAALRDYIASADARIKEGALHLGIQALAFRTDGQMTDFESASRWIDSTGFSAEELQAATCSIQTSVKLNEAGRWIEWLGNSALPDDVAKDRIHQLAMEWTKEDYRAAGQWLVDAPDSTAKQTAVRAYAETVFPYDQAAAYQWARTLPPGPDRDVTLKRLDDRSGKSGGN